MIGSKVRQSVVDGRFYPASANAIKKQIASFIGKDTKKEDVSACMLPHAGYVYSGRVAAETISNIEIKDKVILLGPNHTGNGSAYSIMAEGVWQTPLGRLNIDKSLSRALLDGCAYLRDDPSAHLDEHSIEVELPILQYFKNSFEIVPIAFMSDDLTALKKIGFEIAQVIKNKFNLKDILLVASSDMTHYEPQEQAIIKDNYAIQAILEFDPDRLMEEIKRHNITMCGYAPVIVMLSVLNTLGTKEARLIKYQTSGDVTGDKTSVVGYAGIIFN